MWLNPSRVSINVPFSLGSERVPSRPEVQEGEDQGEAQRSPLPHSQNPFETDVTVIMPNRRDGVSRV